MRLTMKGLLLGGMVLAALPASAAQSNVTFTGVIPASCTLTAGAGGMAVSSNLQTLTSRAGLGAAASVVTAVTTGGTTLRLGNSVAATPPPADTTPTNWAATFTSAGAHNKAADNATPLTMTGPGLDVVTVNVDGTKSGADTFVTGTYTAVVTVICE